MQNDINTPNNVCQDESTLYASSKPLTFTVFTSIAPLGKEFTILNGAIHKISHATMWSGSSKTVTMTLSELKAFIPTLGHNQALAQGVINADIAHTANNLKMKDDAVSDSTAHHRGKACYSFSTAAGFWLVDYDGETLTSVDAVITQMLDLMPELNNVELLGLGSSSNGVYIEASPHIRTTSKGCHVYIAVSDATAIPQLNELLKYRSWKAGLCGFKAGKSSWLTDTVFDHAVSKAEHLIFENRILGNGIAAEPRNVHYIEGNVLDVATMPFMTATQEQELNVILEKARAIAKGETIAKMRDTGVSEADITKTIKCMDGGFLAPDTLLKGQNTGITSVSDIVAAFHAGNGAEYESDTFIDPNDDLSTCVRYRAKVKMYASGITSMHSFDGGKRKYILLADTSSLDESPFLNGDVAEEPPIESRKKLWLNADDMATNAKPAKYLIDQILVEDAHGILGGASMALKSFTVLKMAHCICTGNAFMGNAVYKTGKVIYICGEGQGALERRMRALTIAQGGFNNNLIVLNIDISIDNEQNMKFLAEQIQEIQPVLVIFDTFASLINNTEENSTSAVGNVLRLVKSTCKTITNTTSIIVHHYGKDASKGLRGASNFTNDTEFNFLLERNPNTLNTTLSCGKQKDGEEFAPISLKARIVQLGFTEQSGKESTSLVIEEGNGVTSKKADFNPETKEIFTALSEIINSGETVSLECLAFAVESGLDVLSAKMVLESEWRKHSDSKKTGSTDAKRMAFARSKKVLMEKNKILIFEGYVILVEPKPF